MLLKSINRIIKVLLKSIKRIIKVLLKSINRIIKVLLKSIKRIIKVLLKSIKRIIKLLLKNIKRIIKVLLKSKFIYTAIVWFTYVFTVKTLKPFLAAQNKSLVLKKWIFLSGNIFLLFANATLSFRKT